MDNSNLPSITIVTPSLNQGSFIEATIISVLSQNYPKLEYIVADGGSTDNTLIVLEQYSGKLHWYSKKDKGQTDAINVAMRMATGDVVAYLNADDILLPGSLLMVAEIFAQRKNIQWLTGQCRIINENGKNIRSLITLYKNLLLYSRSYRGLLVTNYISQPATFWRKSLLDICGLLDEDLHYVMDYEYWLRLYSKYPPLFLPEYLAFFRVQRNSKTTRKGHSSIYIDEEKNIIQRYTSSYLPMFLHNTHRYIMTMIYSILNHR